MMKDEQVRKEFLQNNFQDYYVNTSLQVIKYLIDKDFIDRDKIYLVGHSQGYHVAAKLGCLYPQLISKTVCMSSNPFDRQSIYIYSLKKKETLKEMDSNLVQQKLDSIYLHQKEVAQWNTNKDSSAVNDDYYQFKNDYSFNFDPSLDYMLKMEKPLLVVYGSNDDAAALNDYLPLFFYRQNKNNLTMMRLPNLDHNFFSKTEEGKEEFNWPTVLTSVGQWLDKE